MKNGLNIARWRLPLSVLIGVHLWLKYYYSALSIDGRPICGTPTYYLYILAKG
jgi:hypothetical protein